MGIIKTSHYLGVIAYKKPIVDRLYYCDEICNFDVNQNVIVQLGKLMDLRVKILKDFQL